MSSAGRPPRRGGRRCCDGRVYAAWPRIRSVSRGPQWSPPPRCARRRARRPGSSRSTRSGRRRAPTRTIRRRSSSAGRCRRARSCTASWQTDCRSRTGIRPVFVGRGFGNYEDRKRRDDVRYILTYVAPNVGYEGPVIRGRARGLSGSTIIRTFDVAETTTATIAPRSSTNSGTAARDRPASAGTGRAQD